jgi:hypothetical protein
MKALNIFSLILLFFFLGCKDKAKSAIKIKSLTTEQIEKAISMADSIRIIGEPRVTAITIWDTTLKKPVTLHETRTQLELFVSLDDDGNPISDSTTPIAMKLRPEKVVVGVTCSYSCKRDRPESTCQDASGCKFSTDGPRPACTEPNCGSGCSLLRGCKMDITMGFSASVMQ